ncbi:MAG: helix-turn-helix transcriptional regulator [Pseudomonadota bacterium]
MLQVPGDLAKQSTDQAFEFPEASIISYQSKQRMLSDSVLVTKPTLVLVCAGIKQLNPQDGEAYLEAPAGSVVAMRSGTQIMSEFHGHDVNYQSIIFSLNRTFLREAVGVFAELDTGPRVVVSAPSAHALQLFQRLPIELAEPLPDIERQFKLRELLIALMSDQAVRHLILRETSDWGNTDEERLVFIVTTHFLSPLQVPELAKLCAMSLSSFKRHFQTVYGTSPGKWLTSQRLAHARSMVVNSNLTVSEICRACGYRDVSSFVRAFRRNFKASPTELRLQR